MVINCRMTLMLLLATLRKCLGMVTLVLALRTRIFALIILVACLRLMLMMRWRMCMVIIGPLMMFLLFALFSVIMSVVLVTPRNLILTRRVFGVVVLMSLMSLMIRVMSMVLRRGRILRRFVLFTWRMLKLRLKLRLRFVSILFVRLNTLVLLRGMVLMRIMRFILSGVAISRFRVMMIVS